MSKASSAPGKWLILRGYEQTEPGHAAAEPESLPAPPGAAPTAHLRSPTGDTGLPCDWLFTVATESVLIVDAASSYVIQANPAAAGLLRAPQAALIGARVSECFEAASQAPINDSIDLARTSGRAETVRVRACGGEVDLDAKISFFQAGAEAYLLVRLSKDCERSLDGPPSPVFDAIEGADVGFVITDSGLRIEYANRAFIEMADLPPLAKIHGNSVARWLEFSAADMSRLQNQMLQCQATTLMTARLRSEQAVREVEVCAVAVPDGPLTCWGFTVREFPTLN